MGAGMYPMTMPNVAFMYDFERTGALSDAFILTICMWRIE